MEFSVQLCFQVLYSCVLVQKPDSVHQVGEKALMTLSRSAEEQDKAGYPHGLYSIQSTFY